MKKPQEKQFDVTVFNSKSQIKVNGIEVTLDMNFEKVSIDEIKYFLNSQTTASKMVVNNRLKKVPKAKLEKVKKPIKISVRRLLDKRRRSEGFTQEKALKVLKAGLKTGKSKEDLKRELEALLNDL